MEDLFDTRLQVRQLYTKGAPLKALLYETWGAPKDETQKR